MNLEDALLSLENYIEQNGYKGYDPYDALKSPLFKLPVLSTAKIPRYVAQQVVKRSPVNLRPVLAIPKGLNPVTLGLCIEAYTYRSQTVGSNTEVYIGKLKVLIKRLNELVSKGFSGACWGYDFDWQARYANIPAYVPTIVATGMICNALFECYRRTGLKEALELCVSTASFVLHDINRTYEGEGFCFSYSPNDHQIVLNASMKGVKILSQVYHLTRNAKLLEEAAVALKYVIKCQHPNGSWPYSLHNAGINRVDNYHTGYVLDALDEYIKNSGDTTYQKELQRGYAYYRNNFFEDSGMPKFYDRKAHPADCTAAAQSILTLTRFSDLEQAKKVADWMVNNMQSKKGFFYFRKFKYYTNGTSMMRWSNAWMFLALSTLLSKKEA